MAMAGGRSRGYQYMGRALRCSQSVPSPRFSGQDHVAEPGLQSQGGVLSSQEDGGDLFTCTKSSKLGFTIARGGISRFSGTQRRSNNFAAVVTRGNQIESTFPERGVRYYRGGGGGGRGRGRTFHDFDREFGRPGEGKGLEGREGSGFDSKDEFGGGVPRGGGDYRKLDFDEQEEEKPETPEERRTYMRAREREVMLQKFKTQVIDVNRTFKVTKGGGEISFTALVICGNGDGLAGWAKGKGPKATSAIREASVKALNNLYYFERFKGQTIYHYVEAKYEKTKVRLWPEWTLGKFRAAGIVKGILRLAGISSVKSKLIGSSNPHNAVKATFLALSKIKTPKEYEEKYWRAVVERHLILDADGKPDPEYRKVSSYVL